jgi:2-C-methyl-D-erythritol 2,4-cyclodiphosphate synthase
MIGFRIGQGYDVHRLTEGRKLILGGVEIESPLGLLGHSDADVLVHAVMDAVIGALGLGDIGLHFPDTDGKYKDINSLLLAKETALLLKTHGYRICNIDATLILQAPKVRPYIDLMRKNIADVYSIPIEDINIKATTEEKLGFTGEKKGVAAHAVCLIERV